ncbi:N-acetyltransferase family protein [Neisseriaceae bacterium B1]
MSHIIRHATAQDLAAIVAIYNSTIASRQVTADLRPVSVAERETWLHAHLNGAQRPIFVLENAVQEVLAWGSFSDYYPRAAYRITAEISIYVAENVRGQGLGQTLLDHMSAIAPSLGIHNIIGVIFGHNAPSLKLFLRNGFEQWGVLPQVCDLDGKLADVVILGKHLKI